MFATSTEDSLTPEATDTIIGANLREARRARGLSQQQLADRIGKSAKQYRKYEAGTARITAAMVLELSEMLGTTPGMFYRNLDAFNAPQDDTLLFQAIDAGKYVSQIKDPTIRAKLVSMIQEIEASQDRR